MIDQTLNSRFYYPLKLYTAGIVADIDAPFVADLGEPYHTAVRVLSIDKGRASQGLYVCDRGRWQFALPMVAVSEGVIIGYSIRCYIQLVAPIDVQAGTRVFRNGAEIEVDQLTPGMEVWTTLTPLPAGSVNSVNNVLPDSTGNIQLDNIYELSVSLPFAPNADESVFYQQLPACVYQGGKAACEGSIDQPIEFAFTLDQQPVGSVVYLNGSGTVNLTLTTVTNNQILEVVAPPVVPQGVDKFTFTLTFKRT